MYFDKNAKMRLIFIYNRLKLPAGFIHRFKGKAKISDALYFSPIYCFIYILFFKVP